MASRIHVGDKVKLLGLPQWLIHDLPESEQKEMLGFVGRSAIVSEIDDSGYYWIGFGDIAEVDDGAQYSGHSFCVTEDFLELDSKDHAN